jgi:hypothetical protein
MENTTSKIVGIVKRGESVVDVVKVVGMTGYRFDAHNKESLQLAVDLAYNQVKNGMQLEVGK